MLQLNDQAASILARLNTLAGVNQTEYLDTPEDFESRPVRYPAVSLVLGEAVPGGPENMTTTVRVSWLVLVTAKNMTGSAGLLAVTDQVLGVLSGYQPLAGSRPLAPAKIEFLERNGEVSTYAITFITLQRAPMHWVVRPT